jgi:GcrA cell cycle regulator
MDWTEDRIADLRRYWLEGLSAAQVARRLGGGVTRNAVIGRVHRMGLAGRDAPSRPRPVAGRPPRTGCDKPSAGGLLRPRSTRPPLGRPPLQDEVEPSATIHTLSAHTCRWPIGDPGEASFGFCGRRAGVRGPYCETHTALAGRRVGAQVY